MMQNEIADRASRIASFNPGYTWPGEAHPFRFYLDHPKCRIFIIECFTHNWKWMSKWRDGIRSTDIFLVHIGWDQTGSLSVSGRAMIDILDLNPSQFCVLANNEKEVSKFESLGIPAEFINHNAWLDENGPMQPRVTDKIYDAIYVARLVPGKRHYLASAVKNLALVAGNPHQKTITEPPPHVYRNTKPLPRTEVAEKINQSHAGLLLSETEGACYSSSEYLLCGVPVVSTPSRGGRDIWYNEYNALVVEPTPEAVLVGVEEFIRNPRDPMRIRAMHMEQAIPHRQRFIALIGRILAQHGITDIDAEEYFRRTYFEKMKNSNYPDYAKLFGTGPANEVTQV